MLSAYGVGYISNVSSNFSYIVTTEVFLHSNLISSTQHEITLHCYTLVLLHQILYT